MKAIFTEIDGAKRLTGSGKNISVKSDSKKLIETSKLELNEKVPDSFEGGWKDNKEYFKLNDSDSIVFDESYEPPKPTGEN